MTTRFNPRILIACFLGGVLIVSSLWWSKTHQPTSGLYQLSTPEDTTPTNTLSEKAEETGRWTVEIDGRAVFDTDDNNATYTPPTTITGRVAIALFNQSLLSDLNGGTQSRADIINNISTEVFNEISDKPIMASDIKTTMGVDKVLLKKYGNEVVEILFKYSNPVETTEAMTILKEAIALKDANHLVQLDDHIKYFEIVLEDTKKMTVPIIYLQDHLNIINSYQAHLTDLQAMRGYFDDPLKSDLRAANYFTHVGQLAEAYSKLYTKMYLNGVTWNDNDAIAKLITLKE